MIALGTFVLGLVLGVTLGVRYTAKRYHRLFDMQKRAYGVRE